MVEVCVDAEKSIPQRLVHSTPYEMRIRDKTLYSGELLKEANERAALQYREDGVR